jgi:hypothetical protein
MNQCQRLEDKKFMSIKRKFLAIFIFLFISSFLFAQKDPKPTSVFSISGKVKSPVTVSIADLRKMKVMEIGDVVITNHAGEPRGTAKALKGVLLRDVLSLAQIDSESPKVLSEYYIVCKANDKYTVVYSWNEIFNSAVGDSAFIVLEKEGQAAEKMDDSILMISPKDFRTGRRHVKALTSIEIKRAD